MTKGDVVSKFNKPLVMHGIKSNPFWRKGYQRSSEFEQRTREGKTILESLRERMVDALVAVACRATTRCSGVLR